MDLGAVRRLVTVTHHKLLSRTLTSEDGEKIRKLAQTMVMLEEKLGERTEQEVKASGEYHQKVGEILDFLDRTKERSLAKMEKLQLRFSGLAKDWPKFKILLMNTLSKGSWSIEEKFLLLENALPNHLKRCLPMTITQLSFDWMLNHLSEMFGSSEVLVHQWSRDMANLKFSSSTSIGEIATRLDRLLFQAGELGLTVEQVKSPFVEAMKSLIQVHRKLEPSILPLMTGRPGDVVKVLKQLAVGESMLGIRYRMVQFQSNRGNVGNYRQNSSEKRNIVCVFCGSDGHMSFKCKSGTAESRRAIAARKGLCFRCLKRGHNSNRCTQNVKCSGCNGGHSSALCLKKPTVNNMATSEENVSLESDQQVSVNMVNLN